MTKAEKTRQFIIEQSAPLFNTRGIAGTAMSDVMEATKMAKGGLYGHFESKDELTCAVVDYSLGLINSHLMALLNKEKTYKKKLIAYLDFFNRKQCSIEGGCPMLNFGMEADDTNPVIAQKIKKNILTAQHLIETIIIAGIEAKEFKAGCNAKEYAIKIFALLEGGTMLKRIMGNSSQMDTIVKMLKTEIKNMVV